MLILCGKTAVGKSTVAKELEKLGMKRIVTYTTRPPRENEEDGIDYHFVSEEKFKKLFDDSFFVETTSYHVRPDTIWYYGTPLSELNGDDKKVLIANPYGVRAIKQYAKNHINEFPPLVVCQLKTSEKTMIMRLLERKDDINEAKRRVKSDSNDFESIDYYTDFSFRSDIHNMTSTVLAELILSTYLLYTSQDPNEIEVVTSHLESICYEVEEGMRY